MSGRPGRPPSTLRHRARRVLDRILRPLDLRLVRASELAELLGETCPGPDEYETVPSSARAYLADDNPRLLDLRRRYAAHPAAVHSKWSPQFVRRAVDLALFRRDNAYVFQTRHRTGDAMYVASAYYARERNPLGTWYRLEEDGAFGCHVVDFNGERLVSRDLIDSIIEIGFLERQLTLSRLGSVRVLDVGAGYGRLAHRLCEALRGIAEIRCADAVPESTFLSEFYLRHRGVDDRAKVVPLDEIEQSVLSSPPDLATNIHSFSEIPAAAIAWWTSLLSRAGVRWLMIVPNTGESLLSTEAETMHEGGGPLRRQDFAEMIAGAGYRLIAKEPKYEGASSLQRHGLFPTWYFLFERT